MRMKRLSPLLLALMTACTTAPQYDVVIRHGTVYDGTGAAAVVEDVGINGDRDRGARRSRLRARPRGGGRNRTRRRARVHQHAEPLRDVADRRRPLAGRHPPGRHARGLRRELDGAAQRRDEEGTDRAAGRHQVRRLLDDARRVSRPPRDARHLARTWRRSSAPRRFACTRSAASTARRRRTSSSGCAVTCAARWTKGRWG